MSWLNTLMVGEGTRVTRPLQLLAAIVRHPLTFAALQLDRWRWSERTIVILVHADARQRDGAAARSARASAACRLQTEQDPRQARTRRSSRSPTSSPSGWPRAPAASPQSSILEATANIPFTAHILGGAPIGATAETGVVDADHRVFGYENLLVCDGSVVPANVGVNPSPDHHRDGRARDVTLLAQERAAGPCRRRSWAGSSAKSTMRGYLYGAVSSLTWSWSARDEVVGGGEPVA